MFTPSYTITPELLGSITRIHRFITTLNNHAFPQPILMELLSSARSLSTHASTSIEGNPLPLTEVKKILKNHPTHIRDSEQEVLNYNNTLVWLDEHLDLPLNIDLILKIHHGVTHKLLPPHQSGKLRSFPVVVNDIKTRQPAYLAPDVVDVAPLLNNLIDFIKANISRLDPLVLAGIFHKQFILIHPFMDGNGRTTRLLTKVLLAKLGINTFKLFSFENYYNQNITKYFAFVGERGDYYEIVPQLDFTNWLIYFTDGIIDELIRVNNLLNINTNSSHSLKKHHRQILTYLETHPEINDLEYSKLVKRGNSTRSADFTYMINLGLLTRHSGGPATYYTLSEK
ncbi:MAG: Fic family protein [bacterium]